MRSAGLAAQAGLDKLAPTALSLSAARRALRVLGAAVLLLLLGLSAGYAWQTRDVQIEAASAIAQRRVERLAFALNQTLALGDLAIRQTEARLAALPPGRPLAEALESGDPDRRQFLRALPMPFEVLALDAQGGALGGPAGRAALAGSLPSGGPAWQARVPLGGVPSAERRLPLLRPAAANGQGVAAYAIELLHAALVQRFEAVRHQPGGGVALFRIDADGRGITLLARAPFVGAELGKQVQGPLFKAVQQRPAGWFDDRTQVDGLRRVVAYQRLDGAASSLLLGYGMRTDDVLVAWRGALPWQIGITALMLGLVLLGLAWLDRVLRSAEAANDAVHRSEAQLRALADNLPDVVVRYDRAHRHRFANPAIEAATGLKPAEVLGKTNTELGMPEANVATWTSALDRVFARGRPERLDFAFLGPSGPRHWESVVVPEQTVQGEVASVLVISRDISERVQHAEALARNELRFRLAASYGQVWEWDVAADLLHFPDIWWTGLGHPVPPPGQTLAAFVALVHPDDLGHWRQVLREHLQHRRPYELMFRVATATATGGWRWLQTQGQCTRDAQGRAVYMAGTTFDVTDRQLAQQALRDSQQRLVYLLANSPAVIYTARPEGGFGATYYTPNVQGLLGHAARQFIDEPGFWLAHVHPDDRAAMLDRLAQRPALGHLALEYRFQHADGRWRWLRDDVRLTRDDAGQPLELIGSLVDVTDRHDAEEALRQLNAELEDRVRLRTAELQASERRLRAIFDTVPVALNEEDWSGVRSRLLALRAGGVTDGPGYFAAHPGFVRDCLQSVQVLRINQRSVALQQMPVGAEGPFSLATAFDPEHGLQAFADELAALWAGQPIYTCKRHQTTASGIDMQLMLTMALPAMDAAADGVALVCLVDITEIDRLNAELDATVARLKRINRELETFSYSVSHDLKAPLRGIDGYSQLLLRDHAEVLDEEARSFLGRIRGATLQMGQLIDDLLAYSRLERRDLAMVPVPLHALVQQVLDNAATASRLQGALLRNEVGTDLRALGDVQGLRMALRNLVDNALKFGRPGVPVEVVVGASLCATQSGDVVRLTVRDNGIGFDMKFQDRIFGIFQRLHRAEVYPGTGVGLAIVRKAMDRMGGRVDAFSEPGQGAVFNLDLPVA